MPHDSSFTKEIAPPGTPMKLTTTIEDLIAAYGPRIKELPSNKPRDPAERDMLRELGDQNVEREIDGLKRVAGERRRPPKTRRTP